jgi:hypothetical protein
LEVNAGLSVGAAQLHGQAQEEINHNAAQNQPEMNRNRS